MGRDAARRLLWAVLAETGLRPGEALGLQHRDWHTGPIPWISAARSVQPRHRGRVASASES
jgi:hypothetical protein